MRPRFVVVLLLCALPALAREPGGGSPIGRTDLAVLANRIAGGAALLADIDRSGDSEGLHQRAQHLQRVVEEGGAGPHLYDDWSQVRSAFERYKNASYRRSKDPRIDFLLDHLEEDLRAAERLVNR